MILRRLSVPMALILLVTAFFLVTPQRAQAVSTGCTSIQGQVWTGTMRTFPNLVFEAGETVTIGFSNAASTTTVQLRINDVTNPGDEASLAAGGSVTLDYTFSAGGTFTVQGRSNASPAVSVNMVFGCTAPPAPEPEETEDPAVPPVTPAAPSAVLAAPGIPAGFILRTILCDTPLFVEPDGIAVPGGAAVTVGQTWYLAPEVDDESPGWMEGFFGGENNAWLPAACVA